MKMFLFCPMLALGLVGSASAARYEIDPNHTQVTFTYSHLGYSNLSGRLNQVSGSFDFDPAKPASSNIDVSIPMSSLSTGVPKLDQHLASADFFDSAKFPTATFKSNKVEVLAKDKLRVSGEMTIHGVSRPVALDVTINSLALHPMSKSPAAGFDAVTTLRRSEFGISKNVPMVSDEVRVVISMEAHEAKGGDMQGQAKK